MHDGNEELRGFLETMASRIAGYRREIGEAIFETGRVLIEVKDRLEHGQFLKFLADQRVGYQPRVAQLLMRIAKQSDGKQLAVFGIAKATVLLQLPESERQSVYVTNNIHQLSVSDLQQVVNRLLGRSVRPKRTPHSHAHRAAYDQGRREGHDRGWREGYEQGCLEAQRGDKIVWAAGVLHIKPNQVTPDGIQEAYRRLSKLYHPDKGFTDDQSFMQVLNEARDLLRDFTRTGATRVA